jgi:phosphatidylglycerophosphate synthase
MGLRGVVAADGAVMAPSFWGKLKTNVQFFAILLAILRPDLTFAGAYADEWLMVAAALITIGSAVDYIRLFGSLLREEPEDAPPAPVEAQEPVAPRLAQPTVHSAP